MLRGGDAVGEGYQVFQPADIFEVTVGFEGFFYGQYIKIAVGFKQFNKGFPDPTVAVEVEILGINQRGSIHIGIRRDEHRANESLFHVAVEELILVGTCLGIGNIRLIAHLLPHLWVGFLIRRVFGLVFVVVVFANLPKEVLKNIKIRIHIG